MKEEYFVNTLYAITQRVTVGLQHQQANHYITLHRFSKLKQSGWAK